jgi:hypothetical protein
MAMNPLDTYKFSALKKMSTLKSMREPWSIWQPLIRTHLTPRPDGQKILELGEKLSAIFRSNKTAGRNQSDLSTGGIAWECLNVWYLNLLFWGTPVVSVRTNKSLVPECLRNALTVNHSSVQTNTESDVSIFSVPEVHLLQSGQTKELDSHLKTRMDQVDFVNLQCKTNWNDNAQIPMPWDAIYNSKGFKISSITLGIKGFSPNSFQTFRYAFSTVPTVKVEKFKNTTLAVLRVRHLSGGNYWGHATKRGIATCINELPNNYYSTVFSGGIVKHLNSQINHDPSFIEKFIKLDF